MPQQCIQCVVFALGGLCILEVNGLVYVWQDTARCMLIALSIGFNVMSATCLSDLIKESMNMNTLGFSNTWALADDSWSSSCV